MIVFKVCSSDIVDCHSWVEAELTGLHALNSLHGGQGLLYSCSAVSLQCMNLFVHHHKLMQRICEVFSHIM